MSEYRLLIDGKMVEGDEKLEVLNPATEKTFATVSRASRKQADQAVQAAKAAFPAWSKTPVAKRQEAIVAIADALKAHKDELARLLTAEQGKPLSESKDEIDFSEMFLRHYATLKTETKVIQDDENARVEVHRVPLGVVVGIVAWNFPLTLACWKIGPCLVAGNTIVLKPAPTTPVSTLKLGELIRAIVPPGVVNIIADANDLGDYLTSHPDVAKVSFTGSIQTGRKVMKSGSDTLKHLTLELGGNDAAIVLDDVNVKETAKKLFSACMLNCGQCCIAVKRVYVQDAIYDEMAKELEAQALACVVGDGASFGTSVGPLQNRAQYEKVKSLVESAKKEGARVVGGEVVDRPGYFIRPGIVREAKAGMRIVDEEQFGPVIPLIRFKNEEEVLRQANATQYGLGGSVWSSNVPRAKKLAEQLEAGTVWINQHLALAPHIPFGGNKQSGIGTEHALSGLEEFTQIRVLNIAK